ncbi:MAG: zinc ribbon domain-containing protein, partial [Oscillospiraceae bacterium]|nr:zinc ribbon domain-containing protein [Oscillospiraceae bacterium]
MALIKCPECGTEVSDKAIACPKCAYPIQQGIVDVSGRTVKVDSSKELDNLFHIARRAKDDNNAENASKYYD